MAKRSRTLDTLRVGSECKVSWGAMEGGASCRFCAECRRTVLDFAQMTPREILSHLEASRGDLCARLTWAGDRLAVARPATPFRRTPAPPKSRTSAVAATLVGAWLGAGTAEAGAAPTVVELHSSRHDTGGEGTRHRVVDPGRRAALRGAVSADDGSPLAGVALLARNGLDGREWFATSRPDGTFRFGALPAGLYDLEGRLAGYDVTPALSLAVQPGEETRADITAVPQHGMVTMGVLMATAQPLRSLFDSSDLVVTATAGPSVVVRRDEGVVELLTELRIESRLKGTLRGRAIGYRRSEYVTADSAQGWPAGPAPGARVLAFLEQADDAAGWAGRTFESADSVFGVKTLGDEERAAYLERIDDLVRLDQETGRRGEPAPEDVVEWLVGAAEDPVTRGEATGELSAAVAAVRELGARHEVATDVAAKDLQVVVERFHAEGGKLSRELRPEVLGAFLTGEHQDRLTAALLSTRRLRDADFALFSLVRAWAGEAATLWLARRLLDEPVPGDLEGTWWLATLAEELEDPALDALVDAASERMHEIESLWPEDGSEDTLRLRERHFSAVQRELRHRFADALAD